jgi:hypothetical protein
VLASDPVNSPQPCTSSSLAVAMKQSRRLCAAKPGSQATGTKRQERDSCSLLRPTSQLHGYLNQKGTCILHVRYSPFSCRFLSL